MISKRKVSLRMSEKPLDGSLEDIISSFNSFSDKKARARFVGELLADFVGVVVQRSGSRLKINRYKLKIDGVFSYIRDHNTLNADDLETYTRTYNQIIRDYLPS